MKKTVLLSLLFLFSLTGCQIMQSITGVTQKDNKSNQETESSYTLITQDPWHFIQNELLMSIPDNKRILAEKEKILRAKLSFTATLSRSEPYIYYIVHQLSERSMPVELAMIPLIESAYNPLATSHAKAAGLWQIVPVTAREYGLTKSNWYDPRRDLVQSTDTAINLLQYLNRRFEGDWLLALAAYNAGEGRVRRAIAWNKSKGLPTNFWALNLPKETMQYIPKFLAIIDIIKNNQRYKVSLPDCTYANSLVRVDLSKQISLDKIAEYSKISIAELLEFNAGYLKKEVNGPYHLFIPSSYADTLYKKLHKSHFVESEVVDLLQVEITPLYPRGVYFDAMSTNKKYAKITDSDIHHYQKAHKQYGQIVYRVKTGDNLYSIAKKHNVTVGEIVKWNKITNANELKAGDRLTINIKKSGSL